MVSRFVSVTKDIRLYGEFDGNIYESHSRTCIMNQNMDIHAQYHSLIVVSADRRCRTTCFMPF